MGYYGGRNLGDEMMLVCLLPWLRAQRFDVTVLTENPSDVAAAHGVATVENVPLLGQWAWRDAWFRGKAFRLLRAVATHDAFIVGGGELIRDDGGWRRFFMTTEKMIAAFLMGKEVSLVNIGIAPPRTRYGRALLRAMLPRCTRIVARDRRTVDVCHQFGAGAVTVYAPDIVLSLPNILPTAPLQTQNMRPYALICLRGDSNVYGRYPMSEQRVRNLAAGCDYLVERHQLDVVFLPFQSLSRNSDDNILHERVARAMTHQDRAIVRPWTRELPSVVQMVRGASFVLAMRFHAAVLAAAFNRPCVLMPYDEKIGAFAQQARLRHTLMPESLDRFEDIRGVLDSALGDGRASAGSQLLALWDGLTLGRTGGAARPVPAS